MQSNFEINKMLEKFEELKMMDENYGREKQKQAHRSKSYDIIFESLSKGMFSKEEKKVQQPQQSQKKQQIYTKTTIAHEVAKLKPYLTVNKIQPTTDELEEMQNQEYSAESYKMLCNLIILENRKLCRILQQNQKFESKNDGFERAQKQKEGWVFEIFYRSVKDSSEDITKKNFVCMYAVFTQIVHIYSTLTFSNPIQIIQVNEIVQIKYLEDVHYEIIQISLNNGTIIDIGFLNIEKFNMFDRLLFLQKNMAKSTTTKLFENQLIKDIYQEYDST